MDVIYEKIGKKGEIIIPKSIGSRLGFVSGQRVKLKPQGDYIVVSSIRSVSKELRGSIKIKDKKKIREVIESETWDLE